MLASGNGTPQVCIHNLMRLWQGEIPYDRLRGMNPDLTDKTITEFRAETINHAVWLIETYEPRVKLNDSNIVTDTENDIEVLNLNTIIGEADE